jgi:hypothetical protein
LCFNYTNMELITGNQTEGSKPEVSTPAEERERLWEENHKKVAGCIAKCLKSKEGLPTINRIAELTGLCRRTISRHIREFDTAPSFREQRMKYVFMISEIMNTLCGMALRQDVRAARLYMELMGMLKTDRVVNNNFINERQTSHVQLNGIDLSEEMISNLSEQEKKQIVAILMENWQAQAEKNYSEREANELLRGSDSSH